jgi:hypothetical protein
MGLERRSVSDRSDAAEGEEVRKVKMWEERGDLSLSSNLAEY